MVLDENLLIDLPYLTISNDDQHHNCQNEDMRRCMNSNEMMRIYYSNKMFFSIVRQKKTDMSAWGNLFELTKLTTRKIAERSGLVDLKLCYPTTWSQKKIAKVDEYTGLFSANETKRATMGLLLLLI